MSEDNANSQVRGGSEQQSVEIPEVLSVLPMRGVVIFPGMIIPWQVQRESTVRLIDDAAAKGNRFLCLAAMRDPEIPEPGIGDVYRVGVAGYIRMMLKLPDRIQLMLQGMHRVEIVEVMQSEPYAVVRVRRLEDQVTDDPTELDALKRTVAQTFRRMLELSPQAPEGMADTISGIQDPGDVADFAAANSPISIADKQELLETLNVGERLRKLLKFLTREVQMLELQGKIQSQVSSELSKTQREYYLREQLKAIQKELGESDERTQELDELRERIAKANMPEEARKEAERELDRLSKMPPAAAEYTVSRTYLDWLVSLPWSVSTEDNLDIANVKQVLDEDHYGLEKVKDRILEYLSVRKFKTEGNVRHPILCFVGPPGVGKTSLGRSIARALGRKFVRMSLGGIRDEAEIRGHRRTYIGALPGQIIQGIRRAEVNNPVFMLDEIDKVGMDFRGDPTSALLEVLDPEQNSTFRDHYLEVAFDLSKVLFITTANILDTISPPLRDRMEVLELSGYTEEEKIGIAMRHLIPKQMREHGLEERHMAWDESAVRILIRGYTREAGVRNLEREIASVCRKATREFAEGRQEQVVVNEEQVRKYLGSPRFEAEEIRERIDRPGVATGLAWTPVGGEVLVVEAISMPGDQKLLLTGMLGEVMKESAQAALTYVRSKAKDLGIEPDFYRKTDIHIHVPAGAIPKDGPSAGITITTALASLLTGRKVRPDTAMTGEVTLTGRVLPVGGIKEKVLAANRAGMKLVVLPARNRKDVEEDVPEQVRRNLEFRFVESMEEVLDTVLEPVPVPTAV
ncbi:MAG: endopeptidase La [Armatimonadota bacterium]